MGILPACQYNYRPSLLRDSGSSSFIPLQHASPILFSNRGCHSEHHRCSCQRFAPLIAHTLRKLHADLCHGSHFYVTDIWKYCSSQRLAALEITTPSYPEPRFLYTSGNLNSVHTWEFTLSTSQDHESRPQIQPLLLRMETTIRQPHPTTMGRPRTFKLLNSEWHSISLLRPPPSVAR